MSTHGRLVNRSARSRARGVFCPFGGRTRSLVVAKVTSSSTTASAGEDRHGPLPPDGGVALPEPIDHAEHGVLNEQGREERGEEPERRQDRAFVGVGRHHAHEGRVRHVDDRIDHHQQRVGRVGVDQPAGGPEAGRRERQHAEDAERQGEPQQIGPELAPSRFSAIGDQAHHRVHGGVPDLGNQEHQRHRFGGEPERRPCRRSC